MKPYSKRMAKTTGLMSTETANPRPSIPVPLPDDWKQIHLRLNALARTDDRQSMVDDALRLLIDFTQADSAVFFRYLSDNNELAVEAVSGDDSMRHLVGLRLPRQGAYFETNLLDGPPIVIGDLTADPLWLQVAMAPTTTRLGLNNLINLPLMVDECLWGMVQIYNYRAVRLDLLEALRDRVALELERRETLDNLRHSNQVLTRLVDVIGSAGGILDRKQILQQTLEQATELVDAERASIFITEPGSGNIGFQIAYQNPGQPSISSPNAAVSTSGGERKPHGLFSRSAITVPIRQQNVERADGEYFRSLGGMMALNPNRGSFTTEDQYVMDVLAQHTGNMLQLAEVFESTEELFLDVIKSLVAAIDAKDPYTQGHSQRVSDYSVLIAQELGLDKAQINDVRIGSLLHDIGKIGIPDVILKKNGKLSTDEYAVIKNHPFMGGNILSQVALLEPIMPAIIQHHEKLDGSGYPHGLHGEQISLMGRIVAVADVFDAMSSNRPYRAGVSVDEVLDYLEENAGTLFDPGCVQAVARLVEKKKVELAG